MNDDMLRDAIKTALDYGYEIKILRRVILFMGIIIAVLFIGYFV